MRHVAAAVVPDEIICTLHQILLWQHRERDRRKT